MSKIVSPSELRMGMRVIGFTDPWWKHPFWRKNFVLDDTEMLERLQASALEGVIVEDAGPAAKQTAASTPPPSPPKRKPEPPREPVRQPSRVPPVTDHDRNMAEIERAKTVIKRSKAVVFRTFEQARLGRAVQVKDVIDVVDDIVESVERHPTAMLNVARLKDKNEYTYMHSVAVCTLMVNLARTLNIPEREHRTIGLAGLLHDVGKAAVPIDILEHPGRLTDAQFAEIKSHPERGRDLISGDSDVPREAIDVCLHHHERMDGRGYPFGLSADQLSREARMGAICDVYDALTSDRVYKESWTPVETLTNMLAWEGHFDRPLLFQFMRSVGVFPPGLLVELRSRRLAVTLPNRQRNSRPRVRAFFDLVRGELIDPVDIVLSDSLRDDQVMGEGDEAALNLGSWSELSSRLLAGGDLMALQSPPATC